MTDTPASTWLPDELEAVPACPLCGDRHRVLMHRGLTDCVFRAVSGEWTLYRCTGCTGGYLDPRPTPESIGRAYRGYYTHGVADHAVVRRVGHVRRWLHDLVNGYQNHRYALDRDPSTPAGRWLLPLVPPLRAAADAEVRHLPRPPHGQPRLLDVGCGNGGFLALVRSAGWQVEGIDFDAEAVETARSRGLTVHHGGFETLSDRNACFDVVTLSHVIEHVHDPLALLSRIHGLLKPGGTLWLETPNLDSLGAMRFGVFWRGLETPRHLVLFTPHSLRRALEATGFVSLRQHWRALSLFGIFAESEALARPDQGAPASYRGLPPIGAVMSELREMVRPSTREFLTFTACKAWT